MRNIQPNIGWVAVTGSVGKIRGCIVSAPCVGSVSAIGFRFSLFAFRFSLFAFRFSLRLAVCASVVTYWFCPPIFA